MLYTDFTKQALKLMFEAHRDQTDKSGIPYVFHPYEVASSLEDEYCVCTALLHDVAEDTDITLTDIAAMGFPEPVIEALSLLCHDPDVPYMDYIRKIKTNEIAKTVKLSDLRHNSDLSRLDTITEKDRMRLDKYMKAIKYLED